MKGKRFTAIEEIYKKSETGAVGGTKEDVSKVFRCIISEGRYFEEDKIDWQINIFLIFFDHTSYMSTKMKSLGRSTTGTMLTCLFANITYGNDDVFLWEKIATNWFELIAALCRSDLYQIKNQKQKQRQREKE